MSYSKNTIRKMESYRKKGFEIIEGNNPMMHLRTKWSGFELVNLCQTNSKTHGYSLYTVWAIRKKEVQK